MRFTSRRACPEPTVFGRNVSLPLLVAAASLGCTSTGYLHPGYNDLRPATIAVATPRNDTIHRLDRVAFGGMSQRLLTGRRAYDVPLILRNAAREALQARGYEAADATAEWDAWRPGAPAPGEGFDAVLRTTITRWRARTIQPFEVDLSYRLDLVHVASGERLYGGEFHMRLRGRGATAGPDFLPDGIRQSVTRQISQLPSVR